MPRPARILAAVAAMALTALAGAATADARWQHFSTPAAGLAPATTSPAETLRLARRAFQGEGRGTDLTPLLRRLAVQLPQLDGARRRSAQSLLARPTDGAADPQDNGYDQPERPPWCNVNYCVHYVASGPDAPNPADANGNGVPDYVETVAAVAEQVHTVENDQLGWRLPKSDGTLGGGNGQVDIYLKQIGGTGIYGYAAPDPQQISSSDHSAFAYLVLDDDFAASEFPGYQSPLTPLQVTLAHEYNHVLQFTYDVVQDTWFLESTAVWMEGKVFPEALDYLQYLRGWTELTALPLTTFNGTDPNDRRNVKVYGTSVWNKFLDARYGQTVIRGAWERSLSTDPPSFAVLAYDSSIKAAGGDGFAPEFDRFAAATAEWQAADSGFPEGSLYPDVPRIGTTSANAKGGTVKLNHTTYGLLGVRSTSAPRLRFGMVAPRGTAAALALVGRTGGSTGGDTTVTLRRLPKGGHGVVTLDDPSKYTRLTAVLINSDAKISGSSALTGDFLYAHDNQPYYGRVSTDFRAPRLRSQSPRPRARGVSRNARLKVTFSEPVIGLTEKSFKLIGPGRRAIPSTVRFKAGSKEAKLIPDIRLRGGKRYRVRIKKSVTDTAVNPLPRTARWSFVTRR